MKKNWTKLLTVVCLVSIITACSGGASEGKTITVGATAVPHAEMLNEIVPTLAEQGYTLEVKEFSDYTLLNQALNDGEIDANFFQHTPYLEAYVAQSEQEIVSLGNVHIEPMGVYSKTITALGEIPDGAIVSVPNDATNEARALDLLAKNGLITLKEGVGFAATPNDIVDNPKNLQFEELDAAQLPRTLEDVDISVINTNYALEAGLDPLADALAIEGNDSPYANIIAVRSGEDNREELQALYAALTSEQMRAFIEEKYQGAIVPAF